MQNALKPALEKPMDALLVRLAESVNSARTFEELVRPLLEMLEATTGLESTYLTTVDEAAGVQRILYARNTSQLQIPEGLAVSWEDTLCKRALAEGCSYSDDVAGKWSDSDAARALGIQTYASVAVRTDDGHLYGTLCAASSSRQPLDDRACHVMQLFSRLIGQHVEREQLVERLRALNSELAAAALLDPLTGLSNRRALLPELGRMLARVQRDDRALMVAFVDLDDFKMINDRYGHDAGDRFLIVLAARLSGCLRAGDLIARIGGDEFVVAATMPRENTEGSAHVLELRLIAATCGRFNIGEVEIDYSGASVGVVLARNGEVDAESVLASADAAMYEIKRARRLG